MTIAVVMPVSATMLGGTPVPGSTSVASSPIRSPPRTFTAPISVMVSLVRGAPGGLKVEHHERDLAQRGAELVERELRRRSGTRPGNLAAHPDKNPRSAGRTQRRNTGTTKNGPRTPTL